MTEDPDLTAVQELRRVAATVVELCDMALLSPGYDVQRAMTKLPDRIRQLRFRCDRALLALEGGGTP